MAFGRLERKPASQPMSDINMTPLIDVMLVLLVIFMLTAPLLTSSLKLELPTTAASRPDQAPASVTLAITADGQWHLGDAVVTRDGMVSALKAQALLKPQPDVLVRADQAVPYGRVAELIGLVQDAGLQRVGFLTQPAKAAAR